MQYHPEKSHDFGAQLLKILRSLINAATQLIPCLLIHKGGLVKTQMFKSPKYVGDPINAVRIFNEKKADELLVLDIDATVIQ